MGSDQAFSYNLGSRNGYTVYTKNPRLWRQSTEHEDNEHLNPCLSSPDLLYAELLSILIMLNIVMTWV